jgi:hypothetical protein
LALFHASLIELFYHLYFRTTHETTWAPALWAISLIQQERTAGRYKPEAAVYTNLVIIDYNNLKISHLVPLINTIIKGSIEQYR